MEKPKYYVKENTENKLVGSFKVVPLNSNKTGQYYKTCRAVASLFIGKFQSNELNSLEEIVIDNTVLEVPTPKESPNAETWPTFKDEFYGRCRYYLDNRKL